jgi:hypothetical protein
MDIYHTIELVKTKLEEGNKDSNDLLYGVNVLTDQYADLVKSVPLVLLEAEKTEFINSAQGVVISQEHFITLSCIVSAQNTTFDRYKSSVNKLAKGVIEKLNLIADYKIQKIIPLEQAHSEIMLGSLKSTAVIISVKVQTYWKDE